MAAIKYSLKLWCKFVLIHGKITQKQLFCSLKWVILLTSSKINIYAVMAVFRHFVSFSSKTNPL